MKDTTGSTHSVERTYDRRRSRPVILLVDDEPGVHESCHLLLDEHYDVYSACDGPTALRFLDSHSIDLVLLDLRLPGVDGLAVLTRIHATRPQLDVIVLTAVMSVRTAVQAMKLGAFHYLNKPFEGEELCSLIATALTRRRDQGHVSGCPQQPYRHPHNSAGYLLFVGSELGLLVTMKLTLQRYVRAGVAASPAIALRWLCDHAPTLVVIHDSLMPDEGTRMVRWVQAVAPTCAMLLVVSRAPYQQWEPALPTLPMYRLDGSACRFKGLLCELVELLAVRHALTEPPLDLSPYVIKAMSYISTHYREALQVNTVAEAIGVSAGHLAHLFPSELGMTVKEFVARVRLEVAKQLLYKSEYTLEHIAEQVGLSDASHLSRVFQRLAGDRPGNYRRHLVRAGWAGLAEACQGTTKR